MVVTLAVNRFFKKLPGSLFALVGATAAVVILGQERLAVDVVGQLPGALLVLLGITLVLLG